MLSLLRSLILLSNGPARNTVTIYNVTNGNWANSEDDPSLALQVARGDLAVAGVSHYIVAAGGTTGYSASDAFEVFDTWTMSWNRTLFHLSVARSIPAIATAADRFIVVTGGKCAPLTPVLVS